VWLGTVFARVAMETEVSITTGSAGRDANEARLVAQYLANTYPQ
jgi:hypothetical protein